MDLQQQYDFFLANHYCLFPGALSAEEVVRANAAVDRSKKEDAHFWGGGPRATNVQLLLAGDDFDFLARHESWFPLASKVLDGDIALTEFAIMIREGNQEVPTKPAGWHQDFGIREEDPLGITSLSAIVYLTDVDTTTARYALVPNSHRFAEFPKQVKEGAREVEGEVEILGPAGTAVLVNAGIFHTGKVGAGPRERRTVHTYMQRTTFPSVSNHTLMPRRLWDVADPARRRYFSHFNPLTQAVVDDYAKR